ncbi:MAG TPA: 16S rRNA (guanine(527)-N(7))-methyltransferase RsmG [Candidatus Methylomirabilis sp.]|nr:16S rRNA (guanine(527)-N(7))-methyltransferase RsmG [Candidatus Methylomirabilis sp.]
MDQAVKKLLTRGATKLGLTLTEQQTEHFIAYLNELKRWNRKANLVGFRTDEAVVRHGILESLALLKTFEIKPNLRLIDVGTGAGLPGIPLKIAAPDLAITLVEAMRKKVSFLRQVCRLLQLRGISVIQARAESLHRDPAHREAYDLVTARAVTRLPETVALCTPFMKREGRLILPVGLRWLREAETIRRPDIKIERVLHLSPDRDIIIIAKVRIVSRETPVETRPERVT